MAIFNVPNNKLRAIKVRAIFADPVAAASLSTCPDDQPNCVDVRLGSFGSEIADNIPMYELVMKKLLQSSQMIEDRSNNADSSVPSKQI